MAATPYRKLALAAALREVGVTEHPPDSNDGPRVHVYQQATGAYREPWCASFVCWCYRQAGYTIAAADPAYVPSIEQWGRAHGYVAAAPQPGDLALYDWQRDGVADHIGIVYQVETGGRFRAVEGNTAVGNDSNGGAVMIRDRSVSEVRCFLRVPGGPKPAAKPKPKPKRKPLARVKITGPKGGLIARRTAVAAGKLIPALVRRFGRVTVRKTR